MNKIIWSGRSHNFSDNEVKYLTNVIRTADPLTNGKELRIFEKELKKYLKVKNVFATSSAAASLEIIALLLNLKKNDEIIIPAHTYCASAISFARNGAKIIWADIDFASRVVSENDIIKKINKNTKAIVIVHLYGFMFNVSKLKRKINKKIKIIEDCAQAQGATFKKKKVGTLGITGCYSFYPTKILGAYGDGGFVTTNNKNLYLKIRRLRFYGMEQMDSSKWWNKKYFAVENGTNSRLSEIQAAILNIKIKYLNTFIKKRIKIAKMYDSGITNPKIIKPFENKNNRHVYHLYVVACDNRDSVLKIMKENKISLGIQYPYPIHKMFAYKKSTYSDLTNTENFSKKIFSLPIYPMLEKAKIKKIINILNKV